jgi:hypothetical protein
MATRERNDQLGDAVYLNVIGRLRRDESQAESHEHGFGATHRS